MSGSMSTNYSIKFIQILALIGTISVHVYAGAPSQQDALLAKFLRTTWQDSSMVEQNKVIQTQQNISYGIPLVEDIDFRVRNHGWDLSQQRYALRLKPRSLGSTWAAKRYGNALTQSAIQKKEILINEGLKCRYMILLNYYEKKSTYRLQQEKISILEDQIKVLEKNQSSSQFDILQVIDAENELTREKLDLSEIEQSMILLHKDLQDLAGASELVLPDSLDIPMDTIARLIEKFDFSVDSSHYRLQYLTKSKEIAESRYRLEIKEEKRWLSFIEFGYDHENYTDEITRRDNGKDYNINQAFVVEVGFRLPFLSNAGFNATKQKLDYMNEISKYREEKNAIQRSIQKDILDLQALSKRFLFLKNRSDEVNAEASLKKYLQMRGDDPYFVLKVKMSLLKNEIGMIQTRFGLLRNYIQIMDATGMIYHHADFNFLTQKSF